MSQNSFSYFSFHSSYGVNSAKNSGKLMTPVIFSLLNRLMRASICSLLKISSPVGLIKLSISLNVSEPLLNTSSRSKISLSYAAGTSLLICVLTHSIRSSCSSTNCKIDRTSCYVSALTQCSLDARRDSISSLCSSAMNILANSQKLSLPSPSLS